MQHESVGGRIVSGKNDPRPAAGQRRMREIASESMAEVAIVTNEFLAGLGRPANMAERVQAELIAMVLVRGRRKGAVGAVQRTFPRWRESH